MKEYLIKFDISYGSVMITQGPPGYYYSEFYDENGKLTKKTEPQHMVCLGCDYCVYCGRKMGDE